MALETWMSQYQDKRLAELHMPGAHDAGTAKGHINKTIMGTNSNSATQTLTVMEQVKAGTRLFDLRLKKIKTGIIGFRTSKVVAHHTTAGQGAYGKESFDAILGAAADWWQDNHKTEVLIFRISHTDPDTKVDEIIEASAAGALHTGIGNLCTKTLRDINLNGGGIICILDEAKFGDKIDQAKGIHSFSKYKGSPNDTGIAVCGQYKRTHTLSKVVATGLKAQYDHNETHNVGDHLWHLYWQKTYSNPFSTTGIQTGAGKKAKFSFKDGKVHGGTHAATAHMIKLMQGIDRYGKDGTEIDDDYETLPRMEPDQETQFPGRPQIMWSTLPVRNYMLPNIFSYDFVKTEINQQIVDLNSKLVMKVDGDEDD